MKFKLFKKSELSVEQKEKRKRERYLLIMSAIFLALGFPPSPFPLTLFVALVPYLIVISERKTLAEINKATFLMTFTFSVLSLYWVGAFTLAKDPFLMIGGFLLFFINPVPFLIASSLYYFWRKYISSKTVLFVFPLFWLLYEYLYTVTDWSFPWLQMHNGMVKFTYFIQIADTIGGWGLTLLIVGTNVAFYYAFINYYSNRRKFLASLSIGLLMILLPTIYGLIVISKGLDSEKSKTIKIGLVQPNIDPYDKWAELDYIKTVKMLLSSSRTLLQEKPDLILWPETALPIYYKSIGYSDARDSLQSFINTYPVSLITGMPDFREYFEGDIMPPDVKVRKDMKRYYATYNAVYGMTNGSPDIQTYGKMKLVPFGERVPFVDEIPILGDWIKWGVGLSGWNVGRDTTIFKFANSNKTDSFKVGAVVCYESIYTGLVTSIASKGAQFLVVVTNDSWYGNTSGPYQHRDFGRLRAVETRRYFVRCANGGISCFINPFGQIEKQTAMYESTLLSGEVKLLDEQTFYSKHPMLFPYIAIFAGLVCLIGTVIGKFKKRTTS